MATLYEVTATALNLRAAPDRDAAVLGVLSQGKTCMASGDAVGGWLPVGCRLASPPIRSRSSSALALRAASSLFRSWRARSGLRAGPCGSCPNIRRTQRGPTARDSPSQKP